MLARLCRSTGRLSLASGPRSLQPFRLLCDGKPPIGRAWEQRPAWDADKSVHGRPDQPQPSADDGQAPRASARPRPQQDSAGRDSGAASGGGWGSRGPSVLALDPGEKANLLQFQTYVRQRLNEISARLPARKSSRDASELAFLEEQVVQDHMPASKRKLRDPLRDVPIADIKHTNLPLLSRFVSDAGNILPRRLTGVGRRKQKVLTKAIKRAQILALMPKTWKLPRYRHAQYNDQFSKCALPAKHPGSRTSARLTHPPPPPPYEQARAQPTRPSR